MNPVNVKALEEEPFYTIETLARRLSVHRRTVIRMLKDGEIPSYEFRGCRRIDKADVDSYLAEHRDEGRKAA